MTILRGALSGYGYLPPGGQPGDMLIKTALEDGEAAWGAVSTIPASGDSTQSLQTVLNSPGLVNLSIANYTISDTLTASGLTYIKGGGINSGVTKGSILSNLTKNAPAIFLNGEQRSRLADFGILHYAADHYGIVSKKPYTGADNVVVKCDERGKGGIIFGDAAAATVAQLRAASADSWQGTLNNFRADDYTEAGIRVNTEGSTLELRNCSPRSSVDGAHGAYINSQNVHIYGGQYGANNTGGRNILWKNISGGVMRGGSANDLVMENVDEGEYAVDIDGTTRAFAKVHLHRLFMNLDSNLGTLVRFGRAEGCWLHCPVIPNPDDGGKLAEWGEHSENCGIFVDLDAAKAPVEVSTAATNATKVVYGVISEDDLDDITVAPNLTTIVLHGVVEQPGIAVVHDGSSWTI